MFINTSPRTNWIFIFLVVSFGIAVGGGIIWYADVLEQQNKKAIEELRQTIPISPEDQTPDTSDWQTYRNEEFGFEVKYPGNAEVFHCENVGCNRLHAKLPNDTDILLFRFSEEYFNDYEFEPPEPT